MTGLKILAALTGLAAFAQPQTDTAAPPAFEVATLKHSPPQPAYGTFTVTADDRRPGQIHYANMSLKSLLTRAYQVEDYQIEGPDWLATELYEITAKAPPNTPYSTRMAMLQTLLEERLRVKLHREKKEMPAYVLQVGKSAPTLQGAKQAKINADGSMLGSMSGPGRLVANNQSMEGLASMLSASLRAPVVDMTGIKGEFNLTLEWKPDDADGGKASPGGALERVLPDSVFVALQEKTGLLLKKQKAPVDILIIDRAEKIPTETKEFKMLERYASAALALGPAVFNHLWQSTLFAVVAGLTTLCLSKNRARIRHWLWLAASVKFLVPFALLVTLGSHVGWRPSRAVTQPRIPSLIKQIGQPFAESRAAFAAPIAPRRTDPMPLLLAALWLTGSACLLSLWWRRWRRIAAMVRSAMPVREGIELEALQRVQPPAGRIGLATSASALEPGVFGILHPILLLPAGIAGNLTEAEVDAIIGHELCHVRRRDNLAAAIHMAVEAVFWFHPLVWWIGARLVDERERACDEEVLRLGCEPETYCEGILKICALYVESPLVCVSGVTGSDLKKRIEDIMTHRVALPLGIGRKLLLAAMGVAVVAGPIGVGLMNAPSIWAGPQTVTPSGVAFVDATVKKSANIDFDAERAKAPADRTPGVVLGSVGLGAGSLESATTTVTLPAKIPGKITYWNEDLRGLLAIAYAVEEYQIIAPDWAKEQPYDVIATPPPNTSGAQVLPMLQTLLMDQFRLILHREQRELPAYALVVVEGGPKNLTPDVNRGDGSFGGPLGHMSFQKMGVRTLTDWLTFALDHPVLDKTGIKGTYDFALDWTPDGNERPMLGVVGEPQVKLDPTLPPAAGLIAALSRLGLKLEPHTQMTEMIVVDHAEKVTAK